MTKQLVVNEDTIVQLMAQTALHSYMIELLSVYLLRDLQPPERLQMLETMQSDMLDTGKMTFPRPQTETQAVLLSDIAVQLRELGNQLLERLQGHVAQHQEWEERAGSF
jgi:hypothetical protein